MTAIDDRTEAVSALLAQTEQAHGVFETTELNGVYDQGWPRWYAVYAVEHGIGALVGKLVTIDRLAAFLGGAFSEFKGLEPTPAEGWAAYTARRITTEL